MNRRELLSGIAASAAALALPAALPADKLVTVAVEESWLDILFVSGMRWQTWPFVSPRPEHDWAHGTIKCHGLTAYREVLDLVRNRHGSAWPVIYTEFVGPTAINIVS